LWMPTWLPMWLKKQMWAGGDRFVLDPMLGPRVNALRAELGLAPAEGILRDFWNSPQRVIGLFPEWFAAPQADWPAQVRLTGFPRYDETSLHTADPDLEAFLSAGPPPIVFTPGSAMYHGHQFFNASIDACRKLNQRGILLTRHTGQIPENLPDSIRHFSYAPFSRILPRAAALVHHGGIGTSAQALAAGCPQLVVPFAHDQFDNANRLRRLGVARSIIAKKYTAKSAARELRLLLTEESVRQNCRQIADRLRDDDAVDRTCDLIEELIVPRATSMFGQSV